MSSWHSCPAVAARGKRTWRDSVHVVVVRLGQRGIGGEWVVRVSDDAHDVSQLELRARSCAGLWVERVSGLLVVVRLEGVSQGLSVPGIAQIADHLTHNRPFPPLFAEVVCALGARPLNPPPSRRWAGDLQCGSRACR